MSEIVAIVGIIALVAIVALVLGSPFRGKANKDGAEMEVGPRQENLTAQVAKRTRKKK